MESSMRGRGYESFKVRSFTLRKSTHRRIDPSFLVTRTTGDDQQLFEGSMTPSFNNRSSSSFRACRLASANLRGPNFTRSCDTMVMLWWSVEVMLRSSFDLAKCSANTVTRHSAMSCSSGVSRSRHSSINMWTWSGRPSCSGHPGGPSPEDTAWPTHVTGSHVATCVSWKSFWGSGLMFITRTGRISPAGFTTARATTTLPSHNWWTFASTIPCVTGGWSLIFPGMIISLIGGMITVSAAVILKTCGIVSIRRQMWVVPSIESTPALMSNVHWCDRKKSTPITAGASISATTISCVQSPSHVPKLKASGTRPKELVTLPSASRILPVSLLKGTVTSLAILDNTDGWITLIVDPVSTKPITATPPIRMGRYKLPVTSTSSSTSSLDGPHASEAANSGASAAAFTRFPKSSVGCPEQSGYLLVQTLQLLFVGSEYSLDFCAMDSPGWNARLNHSENRHQTSVTQHYCCQNLVHDLSRRAHVALH